jgi:hypothetical protein
MEGEWWLPRVHLKNCSQWILHRKFLKKVLNENSRSLNKEIEERREINESKTQNHAK